MTLIRGGKGERGAAVVEFAIIGPILFLLIFGLIDFGLIFSDFLAERGGVQTAARVGAVGNVGTNSSCTLTGQSPTTSTDATKLMCLTKDRMGLDSTNARVKILAVDPNTGSGSYADGNELVVCAQYPATSRTKLLSPFISGKVMTTRVSIRVEQTTWEAAGLSAAPSSPGSTGDMASSQESPLPGSSWNCNP